MKFDKNQTEFKDCIQQRVWELATRQVPLEITLPYVNTLKSACEDWYNFCQNILEDMYNNPDRFGFETESSKSENENRSKPEFYYWVNSWLIRKFKNFLIVNQYEIPTAKFRKWVKEYNPQIIKALEYHGFIFEESGNIVIIRNDIYPDMFVAANAVQEAGCANYKVNCGDYLFNCDFRALANYKRTYKDLHLVLSDKDREIAEKINDYAVSHKITPQQCYYFFRVGYKYKGKRVYATELDGKNRFKINIFFCEVGSEAFKMIENEIEKYDDAEEFKSFIVKNFSKCQNCKDVCWKKTTPREAFGKKFFACSTHLTISAPKEQDLPYIFRLLDLRKMLIKENMAD